MRATWEYDSNNKLRKHGDADRLSRVAFQLEAPKDAPKYCAGQMPRCFAINQPRLVGVYGYY